MEASINGKPWKACRQTGAVGQIHLKATYYPDNGYLQLQGVDFCKIYDQTSSTLFYFKINNIMDTGTYVLQEDDNHAPSIRCSETISYALQHSNKQYFGNPFDSTSTVFDEIVLYYPPGGGVFLFYKNGAATETSGRLFCIEPIKVGEYYGNFTLTDTLSNFSKNGIYAKQAFYSDITKIYVQEPGSYRKVYWGKNIGLISIEITHYSNGKTKNWELINYEIKQ